jgi:hypothetical protein
MKYLNPLAFLTKMNGGPVDLRDNAALSLLRKKMLAEVELSDDKLLKIDGQLHSKNDLLQFFDRLQSSRELIYHQQISEDRVLLQFLETGVLTGQIADHMWYKDAGFLQFIAPYYEPLFTVAILNGLKDQDVRTIGYLFSGPLLLDGAHITDSYRRVLRHLKGMDEQLKATVEAINNGGAYRWKYVARFANPTLIKLLNILPDEFNKWRSDYGISLINLALAIYIKNFKEGINVLSLAEGLHTTDYVQERVQVRKKELLIYRKEKLSKHPIETLVGDLLRPLLPEWLTERRFLLVFFLTVITVTVSMSIYNKFYGDKKPGIARVANAEDLFVKAGTGPQMKYLVAQLEYSLSGKKTDSLERDTASASPGTGDDVYGPGFMAALRGKTYTPPAQLVRPGTDSAGGSVVADVSSDTINSAGSSPIDSTGFIDPLHKQSLRVFNRLEAPMVALLQTPDSFYSCYILPHDSTFLPLQTTANRVYFYIGQDWTATKRPATADQHYRLNGFFATKYKNADTFLREGALTFVLDPTYWRYSKRYIPVEIGMGEGHLFVNLLDNNANGVDLYLGE